MSPVENRRPAYGPVSLLLLAAFCVLWSPRTFAQTNVDIPKDADIIPHWIGMMRDQNVKLPTVQQAFEKYFANREQQRGDGFKPFKRWEYWMLHHVRPDGQRPPQGELPRALATFHTRQARAAGPAVWSELGPTRVSPESGRGIIGVGRVNCVAFHPREKDTIFAVSAGGGLWKTTDSGTTWKPLTDSLPVLTASALAIDPGEPQTMYLGTGDIEGGEGVGMGVFKTANGGQSWTACNAGIEDRLVGSILIHPSNPSRLLAGTDKGVFLSTDAGASWTPASPECFVFEMVAKPGDPGVVYASASGYFLRSDDMGSSWQKIETGMPRAFMSIGVTPAAPETVYVLLGNARDSGFAGFYRSTDSGRTFTLRCSEPNLLGWSTTGRDTGGQAFYDLCLAVDTNRPEIVYLGGVNVWRSSDAGATWTIVGYWAASGTVPGVHADHHWLAFSPHDSRLYSANDGGLSRLDASRNMWEDISSGLAASMIYRIGLSPADPGLTVAGFQDNGTKMLSGDWTVLGGGDGMNTVVDPNDPNFIVWSVYYGRLFRTFDKGQTYDGATTTLRDQGAWVTPFFLDARNPRVMYVGMTNVWRTADIRARPVTWTKLSSFPPAPRQGKLCALEQSPTDPNVMFAAREDFRAWRTRNASAAAPEWQEITGTLPVNDRANAIACHRRDPSTIYLASAAKIFMSTSRGDTWSDITGTLPAVATYCLYHDDVGRLVYAGTDFGVFYRSDDGTGDWTPYNAGMPFVPVYDLDIVATSQAANPRVLRAATFGRGLWEARPAGRTSMAATLSNVVGTVTSLLRTTKDSADGTIAVARKEPFTLAIAAGDAEILVAETADPSKADILLRITGGKVSTSFEGRWMAVGALGQVPRTLGTSVNLESAVQRDDQTVLTFTHNMATGRSIAAFVRTGTGEWQLRLTITSKE